ncbi:CU044_5270 family protein [Actinoallomurus spadix]|uniref:CU044_5270 family protein n=1 Tax=Actinoallomurus spadix TaxID=79912 RepID=A0ABN0XFU7_9ACTN|nr:CU044_5270 family protein [Actinoallomurus spadix]MCO5988960.1 CU044_5270 family protein [Actinoallomurus spadix]
MEELELVKRMFTEPRPAPSVLAAGRERVARGTRPRTRRAAPFWAAGVALGAVAATVAVVTVGSGGSGDPATRPSIRLSAAQEVLSKAASGAEREPALTPRPSQWVYYRFAGYDPKRKEPVYRGEGWQRLDGRQDASRVGGRIVVGGPATPEPEISTPLGAWRRLAGLPTEPRAMLAALRDAPGLPPGGPASADERAFAGAAELLWNSPLGAPPKVQSALYRALATLPGVRADRAADAVGEPAVGLSLPHTEEILFDPRTYRYLGGRLVSDGVQKQRPQPPAGLSPAKRRAWDRWAGDPANYRVPPAGALVSSRLRPVVKLVDRPGSR